MKYAILKLWKVGQKRGTQVFLPCGSSSANGMLFISSRSLSVTDVDILTRRSFTREITLQEKPARKFDVWPLKFIDFYEKFIRKCCYIYKKNTKYEWLLYSKYQHNKKLIRKILKIRFRLFDNSMFLWQYSPFALLLTPKDIQIYYRLWLYWGNFNYFDLIWFE